MPANKSTGLVLIPLLLWICAATCLAAEAGRYETRSAHDPNGLGKFYMGREIAQVMGHEGADWLERSDREKEEHPETALAVLKLKRAAV